jgi:hypothetical protein
MEEASGPRVRERTDWVGNPVGEYTSKGPGDNVGAGRKEKYRAWKLGGARAYTIAVNSNKSKCHEWLRKVEQCGWVREGRGEREMISRRRQYLCVHRPVHLSVRRLLRSIVPKRRRESGPLRDGRAPRDQLAKQGLIWQMHLGGR